MLGLQSQISEKQLFLISSHFVCFLPFVDCAAKANTQNVPHISTVLYTSSAKVHLESGFGFDVQKLYTCVAATWSCSETGTVECETVNNVPSQPAAHLW